jgi:hypothetical protein
MPNSTPEPGPGPSVNPKAHPREVADLLTRLHERGVVNIDYPLRQVIEQLQSIQADSTLSGSYAVGWSSYGIVVKS